MSDLVTLRPFKKAKTEPLQGQTLPTSPRVDAKHQGFKDAIGPTPASRSSSQTDRALLDSVLSLDVDDATKAQLLQGVLGLMPKQPKSSHEPSPAPKKVIADEQLQLGNSEMVDHSDFDIGGEVASEYFGAPHARSSLTMLDRVADRLPSLQRPTIPAGG